MQKQLHPRNKHQGHYDFEKLIAAIPELSGYLKLNPKGNQTIDFHNPIAVKLLNTALLKIQYGIDYWNFPKGYLCPPIPGRAEYIHKIADLLADDNYGKIPKGKSVKGFDLGTGANCIYPLIGVFEYAWSFIASDIDQKAVISANQIVEQNPKLKNNIDIRLQVNKNAFLNGILKVDERIDFTLCNPPFHTSEREAVKGTNRKLRNLKNGNEQGSKKSPVRNFEGKSHELWYEGGEKNFILKLINESRAYDKNCCWFSSLVSKESNLKPAKAALKKLGAEEIKTIDLNLGNKTARILAWTFLSSKQRNIWTKLRW